MKSCFCQLLTFIIDGDGMVYCKFASAYNRVFTVLYVDAQLPRYSLGIYG